LYNLKISNNKLLNLRDFLLKGRLYKEAYALGKIVLASNDEYKNSYQEAAFRGTADAKATQKMSGEDETVAMRPGAKRNRRSPSELKLIAEGMKPIRFIAGTESEKRGEGFPSKEGNIYEVLYKGKVAVAKVIEGMQLAEPEVWKKIIKIKGSLPENQARHLPEIYDIIKADRYHTIIVMELLIPPSSHIKKILRTKELRERESVLKNEEFLSEAFRAAFDAIDEFEPNIEDEAKSEVYAMFTSDKEAMLQAIEGELIRKEIKPEDISKRIQDIASSYIRMFNIDDSGLSKEIADEVQKRFLMHIEAAPQPVAKYFSTKDIDNTLKYLENRQLDRVDQSVPGSGSSGLSPDPWQETINKLHEERVDSVYSETPERFLYSEKYMPETKGLFALLSGLNALGVEWSDVHANNIMERPSTRDLVLIDVGFFT